MGIALALPTPSPLFSRFKKTPNRLAQIPIHRSDQIEGNIHEAVPTRLFHQLCNVEFTIYVHDNKQACFSVDFDQLADCRCSAGDIISFDYDA